MMERAVKLKDALTLYQDHFIQLGEMESVDSLASSDWSEISELMALLKPLADALKTAQLVASTSDQGALHTTLTVMEHLLNHLETSKNKQT